MAPRILVVNVHSSRNAGDAALALAALKQLQTHFPDCEVTLAMDDPESHYGDGVAVGSLFRWVKGDGQWRWLQLALLVPATLIPALAYRLSGRSIYALTPRSWRRLLRAYTDADLVISKPGGFLYSSGRGISLLIALYSLWLAWFVGKPVYMFPQSVGPLSRRWERLATRYVLSKLRIIMVREAISIQQLEQCGISPERCHLLPDTAFAFDGADAQVAETWLLSQGVRLDAGPLLGMTTVNWSAQNAGFGRQDTYERACAAAIRYFVEATGGRAVLFPQVTGPLPSQDDRVSARRVAQRVSDLGSAVLVVESAVSADVLRTAYRFADVFIGTRMHSNIFAMSCGVPTIAIGYQPKTKGITSLVGLEEWSIPIEEVDDVKLVTMLEQLWRDRNSVARHLERVIPGLRERAQLPGRMIEQDYTALAGGPR